MQTSKHGRRPHSAEGIRGRLFMEAETFRRNVSSVLIPRARPNQKQLVEIHFNGFTYLSFYVTWLLLRVHQLHLEAHLHLLRLFWLPWLFVDYMDGKKKFETGQCCKKNTKKSYLNKHKYTLLKYEKSKTLWSYNKMRNSEKTNFSLTYSQLLVTRHEGKKSFLFHPVKCTRVNPLSSGRNKILSLN